MQRRKTSLRLLLGFAAILLPGEGHAQLSGGNRFILPDNAPVAVMERSRGGTDATPIRLGDFLVTPRLFVSTAFDDNVFTTRSNRRSDVVFRLSPGLTVLRSGSVASLAAEVALETVNYARYGDLNAINGRLGLTGSYVLAGNTLITASSSFVRTTDSGAGLGTINNNPGTNNNNVFGQQPFQIDPVAVNRYNNNLSLITDLNRVELRFSANWQHVNYSNTGATPASITANQAQRDGDILTFTGRVGYRLSAPTTAFMEVSYNNRSYRNSAFNSEGYRVVGGLRSDLFRLVRGEVFVGYLQQAFNAPFGNRSGVAFGANLRWFPTERLTFTINGSRDVGEPSANLARPGIATNIGGSVDAELLRNWTASAGASFVNISYTGVSGSDEFVATTLSTNYLINRHLSLNGGWRYAHRLAANPASNYIRNQLFLGLRAQF